MPAKKKKKKILAFLFYVMRDFMSLVHSANVPAI